MIIKITKISCLIHGIIVVSLLLDWFFHLGFNLFFLAPVFILNFIIASYFNGRLSIYLVHTSKKVDFELYKNFILLSALALFILIFSFNLMPDGEIVDKENGYVLVKNSVRTEISKKVYEKYEIAENLFLSSLFLFIGLAPLAVRAKVYD